MKKTFSFLILLIVVIALQGVVHAETTGTCGENLIWSLSDDGVLSIEGTGDMGKITSLDKIPWYYLKSDIVQIIIGENVTGLHQESFSYCTNLTSVEFKNSRLFIEKYMFIQCGKLEEVKLGNNITGIGERAFYNCKNLQILTVPESVLSIGNYAFGNCGKLKEVELKAGLQEIENYAFAYCSALSNVSIPNSVTHIGNNVFFNCTNITTVHIPQNVENIGTEAFGGCTNVNNITVASENQYYCSFNGNLFNKDKTILIQYATAKKETEYFIPNTVHTISKMAFWGCSYLTKITIPSSTNTIEVGAFSNCKNLSEILVDSANSNFCSLNGNLLNKDKSVFIQYSAGKNDTSYELPNTVNKINDYAFYGGKYLETISIPDSTSIIGSYAFRGCSNLTEIRIPEGVQHLDKYILGYCNNLKTVYIPKTVLSIDEYAFQNSSYIENIFFGGSQDHWNIISSDLNIYATITCSGTETILLDSGTCGNNLKWEIYTDGNLIISGSGEMFDYSSNNSPWNNYKNGITKITVNGATTIGTYAFYQCANIAEVILAEYVTALKTGSFGMCTKLSSITIPASIESIDLNAFSGCNNITNINFNGSYVKWYTSPYADNYYLKNANIVCVNDEEIYDSGNFGDNLSWYIQNNGVLIISGIGDMPDFSLDGYLRNNAPWQTYKSVINCIVITNGITSVGNYSFYGYYNIEKVSIANSVKNIGDSSFGSCTSLTNLIIPDGVSTIEASAFSRCKSLSKLTIPSSVKTIERSAFSECEALTQVKLSEGLTTLGSDVFSGCTSLFSVNIPGSLTSIGEYIFRGCTSLTDVSLSSNIKIIAKNMFHDSGISEIIIPEGITSVEYQAFLNCTNLKKVTIPKTVESIGSYAFGYCESLTDVYYSEVEPRWYNINISNGNECLKNATLHCELGVIRDYGETGDLTWTIYNDYTLVFSGVGQMPNYNSGESVPWKNYLDSIKKVVINDGIINVGSYAFYRCTELESISFASDVKSIGDYAFYGCNNFTYVYYDGTIEDWNKVSVGSNNANLLNANFIFSDLSLKTYYFETNGGSTVDSITSSFIMESPITTYTGRKFLGWFTNEECIGESVVFPYHGEKTTLYAKWSEFEYQVILEDTLIGYYQEGDVVTLAAKPSLGQLFDYWEVDAEIDAELTQNNITFQMPNKNLKFIAVYKDGGDGSKENPYLIESESQLLEIKTKLSSNYKLIKNITLTSNWTPIGAYNNAFIGEFDGNNHTIKNLYINDSTCDYVGFFGYVSNAFIHNLNIDATQTAGIIVTGGATISTGEFPGGPSSICVGGIVGFNSNGTILNCSYIGDIVSTGKYSYTNNYTGGIVGINDGIISSCYSSINIEAPTSDYTGGITGGNSGIISDCYSTGTINSYSSGGIIGAYSKGTVLNCYSICELSFTETENSGQKGGIIGFGYKNSFMAIQDSYYNSDVVETNSLQSNGVISKTSDELRNSTTYSNWDFDTIWAIDTNINNGYPYLRMSSKKDRDYFGDGTTENPYKIYTPAQLVSVYFDLASYYELMNDIQVDNYNFDKVKSTYITEPFKGSFNGNNKKIIGSVCEFYAGRWDECTELPYFLNTNEGIIENINFIFNVDGYIYIHVEEQIYYAPIVIMNSESGIIRNCTVNGAININIDCVSADYSATTSSLSGPDGGIAVTNNGAIENCSVNFTNKVEPYGMPVSKGGICDTNTGTIIGACVKGTLYCGAGIAAFNTGIIKGSYNSADVFGFSGIVYSNSGTIENCYNTGNVASAGIAGENTGIVLNCYNTGTIGKNNGTVTNNGIIMCDTAGIVASNSGIIEKCYNTGRICTACTSGGIAAFSGLGSTVKIVDCYNSGIIEAPYFYTNHLETGGIVGNSQDTTEILRCYNNGIMYCTSSGLNGGMGGIVGSATGGTTISDCYCIAQYKPTGSLDESKLNQYIQGIVGYARDAKISRCYSLYAGIYNDSLEKNTVDNCFYLAGTVYSNQYSKHTGTSKNEDDLKYKKTYTNVGWDFRSLWDIDPSINNGFPYLNPREPDPGYDAETGRFTQIDFIIGQYYNYGTKKYNFTPTPNVTITCNGVTKVTDENGKVSYTAEESGYDGYKISPVQLTCEGYFSQTYSYVPVPKDGIIQLSISQKNPDSIYISNVTMNDVKGTSHDLTYYRTANIYKTDTDDYTISVDVDWNNHEAGEIYLQTRNGDKKFKFEDDNTLTIPLAQKFDVGDELVIWAYTYDKAISMSKILSIDINTLPKEFSLAIPTVYSDSSLNGIPFMKNSRFNLGFEKSLEEYASVIALADKKIVLDFNNPATLCKFEFLDESVIKVTPFGKLELEWDGTQFKNWNGTVGMRIKGKSSTSASSEDYLVNVYSLPYNTIIIIASVPTPITASVDFSAGFEAGLKISGTLDNPQISGIMTPQVGAELFFGLGQDYDTVECKAGVYGELVGKLPIELTGFKAVDFNPSLEGTFGLKASVKVWIIEADGEVQAGNFKWSKNGLEATWFGLETASLLSLEEPQYQLIGREYLSLGGGFVGNQPQIMLMDLEVTNKDEKTIYENIFSNSEAKLQKISGQDVLYYLIDDTLREAQNGLKLVYSKKKDDGTWTFPEAINEDGTLDSVIEADGEFIMWEDTKEELSSDATLEDVFKATEISVGKYNGSSYDSIRLTDDDIYDFSPTIKVNGDNAIAGWLSNSNSDFTAQTGTTNLHYSLFDGTSWSEVTTIENIGQVSRVTATYNSDNAYIIYKKDGLLHTVSTLDGTISKLNYSNIGQYTVANFNNIVYMAYFDENKNLNVVEDLFGNASLSTIEEEINNNSIPVFAVNNDYMYVTWIEHQGGFDTLSGVRYENGSWSDKINFVDDGTNVSNPSLIVNEDGSFSASYFKTGKYQVQENGSIYSGATNLYVNTIVPSYNLAVVEESVSYDDIAYSEGKNIDMNFDVENIGEKAIEGFNIEIYEDDSLVHSENKTDILKAGETKNVSTTIKQLDNGKLKNLIVKVVPTNVDDFDESDNSITFEIGTKDAEIQDAYFTYNDYTYSVNANIKNNGSATIENCIVQLHNDSKDGEVIYETNIENLKPLETIFVTYEMPIDAELDNCYITVSSESDANEYNNYSVAVYENFDEEIKEKTITFDKATSTATIKSEKEYKDAVVFFATYNNEKLISLKSVDKDLVVGENIVTPEGLSLDGADTVRIFVWESASDMKPLCDACVVELNTVTYDNYTKTVTITSNQEYSNANVFIAAYDNGKLISLKSQQKDIAIGDTAVVFNDFDSTGADTIKVMVWENLNSQKPLLNACTVNFN